MTATTTEREILSAHNGRVPRLDGPAAPARAGARIPVTVRGRKWKAGVARAGRRWWVWTARPASLRVLWRVSAVDGTRIPGKSTVLRVLWQISNSTDRLFLFVLLSLAPTVLQGPLRWLAMRPTRRWGAYLVVALLVARLIGRK